MELPPDPLISGEHPHPDPALLPLVHISTRHLHFSLARSAQPCPPSHIAPSAGVCVLSWCNGRIEMVKCFHDEQCLMSLFCMNPCILSTCPLGLPAMPCSMNLSPEKASQLLSLVAQLHTLLGRQLWGSAGAATASLVFSQSPAANKAVSYGMVR